MKMSRKWYQRIGKEGQTGFVDSLDSEAMVYTYSSGRDGHQKQLGTGGGARAEGGGDEFTAAGIPTVITQMCSETTKATWLTQQPE